MQQHNQDFNENISDEEVIEAIRHLWQNDGLIAPWYLRDSQKDVYSLLTRQKNPFVEAARRFGKTTSILVYVLEMLKQNPGWVCRWCEPWKNQARDIVIPEMEKIQRYFLDGDRFKYQTVDSVFNHPNGSKLYIRGVNEDKGESARGPTSNIIVADEYGSWKDPEYTANEVLRPQLLTTRGQFIFASSPSKDLAHPYYDQKGIAITEGRFIQKVVTDNESLTLEDIEQIVKEVGGRHTAAWRREYMCEPVADIEDLVIPEFNETIHVVGDDYPRPECFDSYVGMDLGLNDHTAVLFGYWDFLNQELVIEREIFVNAKNTREIVDMCKRAEYELWNVGIGGKPPYLRVSDNEAQQIYDMVSMFGYQVVATEKQDKIAAINALRLRFGSGRVKIKRSCTHLIYQLKVGMWNETKKSFQRGDKIGHLDSIDALIYLHRNIVENRNPYPLLPGVAPSTHFIPESAKKNNKDLVNAFKSFGGR